METVGLRRQAQIERASSYGITEEAVTVAYEQAGDERTEADERWLAPRPALADERADAQGHISAIG